jgi:hypothetical protein
MVKSPYSIEFLGSTQGSYRRNLPILPGVPEFATRCLASSGSTPFGGNVQFFATNPETGEPSHAAD